MFDDHELISKFPYYGDTKKYFPTVTSQGSINYGKLKLTNESESEILIDEIMFSHH